MREEMLHHTKFIGALDRNRERALRNMSPISGNPPPAKPWGLNNSPRPHSGAQLTI
jgi:hypothetical protein